MSRSVIVIGGGASGMLAAIRLARGGASVTVVEQAARLGKKLLATGNGRCNLLNSRASAEHYFTRTPAALAEILRRYPVVRERKTLEELGLVIREEEEGRCYPASSQAASVLDALRLSLSESGAEVLTGVGVQALKSKGKAWEAQLSDGRRLKADNVVIACGGRAQPTPPAEKGMRVRDGLELLAALGHRICRPEPVLTAMKCDPVLVRALKGVRARGKLTLMQGETVLAEENGEVLFTEYGLSGIAVMQLPRHIREGSRIVLDLLPEQDASATQALLRRVREAAPERQAENLLAGAVGRLLTLAVLKQAGIGASLPLSRLNDARLAKIAHTVHSLVFPILGLQDLAQAQVMRGGASLAEFDAHLMSRRNRGLYAVGEVLDVDGECGGYNLTFAWASALCAADGILEREDGK